ncbi:hypothetical protein AKJ41_00290 [candidate division MSBL1 archaeon SCGC-AAA259O05]|uniref:Serine/threonine specific protein phosphatases domain-containing protein n=1 Tax=candidate division MSBL1 archaeon SCGC-AAA259O05 TaxID=1698271 RepID=A0A133V5P9_9EURY|nr:hypothetical protein AKJ41_00290 [candidate division MSBL1 archaeon SCGC-AAA259O05]
MKEKIPDLVEDEKVITLEDRSRAIFVGDTHGDLEASKIIWNRFGDEVKNGQTYLVFLGDYVDRGSKSQENIDFLLDKKRECPKGLILLLGNHDAYHLRELSPSDFWQSLNSQDYEYYKDLYLLPWLAESKGLVATHGALPFVPDLQELEGMEEEIFEKKNELDIPIWVSLTWGDINNTISGAQMDPLTGRPQFGQEIIFKYLQKNDWNILIRAHQPGMQGWSFSDNVLTIFTSKAYVRMGRAQERSVAVVELEGRVETRDDVRVLGLSEI